LTQQEADMAYKVVLYSIEGSVGKGGVKNGCIRRTFTALVFNLALNNLDEYRKLESKVTMPQKVY